MSLYNTSSKHLFPVGNPDTENEHADVYIYTPHDRISQDQTTGDHTARSKDQRKHARKEQSWMRPGIVPPGHHSKTYKAPP